MMGLLDGMLGQVTQNVDIKGLAARVGISPEQVESAIAALGRAQAAPGDTVTNAASTTGLSPDILQTILAQLGGGAAVGQIGGMLDRDGDGNPLNDLSGLAGGLFGKK